MHCDSFHIVYKFTDYSRQARQFCSPQISRLWHPFFIVSRFSSRLYLVGYLSGSATCWNLIKIKVNSFSSRHSMMSREIENYWVTRNRSIVLYLLVICLPPPRPVLVIAICPPQPSSPTFSPDVGHYRRQEGQVMMLMTLTTSNWAFDNDMIRLIECE